MSFSFHKTNLLVFFEVTWTKYKVNALYLINKYLLENVLLQRLLQIIKNTWFRKYQRPGWNIS